MCFSKEEIVGLGYNCEISFRIEDYFGEEIEAQLFSWSLVRNQEKWLESFEKDFDLLENGMQLSEADNHMFLTRKYEVLFHPRKDILYQFDKINEQSIENTIQELNSRINYLSEKTSDILKSNSKLLFIIKILEEDSEKNKKFIEDLYKTLMRLHPNLLLVVIIKRSWLTSEIQNLENEHLKIRSLRNYAPPKYSNILGDVIGWKKILDEFCMNEGNRYYYNLYNRRLLKIRDVIKRIYRRNKRI